MKTAIIHTLSVLAIAVLLVCNYYLGKVITQQRFTIQNMLSNPACLVEAPKPLPSTAKKTIKQFVKPTPQYKRVFSRVPNPVQGRV